MNHLRPLFCTIFLVAFGSVTTGSAQTLGSVHAGTYGESRYEEIKGIEVSTRRIFSDYSYDIVIPDTTQADPMILCQLYDNNDEVLAANMKGSNTRETYMHFSTTIADATARCFHAISERVTRPSGPTPQ
ncbi:MAG: hypothetical protein ACSHW1_18820 [Yoonia sp.]|uniref:hypothetical protein n=1 Tax=Yoonia sp. TaxID=2212373 RepID=UPI003EF2274C